MNATIIFKEELAGTNLIALRIDANTLEKIKRVALQQNLTNSAVVRSFIRYGLETLNNQTR
jgi:antitoxin component of RelBE/YafQ-DinJ toxin-antitoxin module